MQVTYQAYRVQSSHLLDWALADGLLRVNLNVRAAVRFQTFMMDVFSYP